VLAMLALLAAATPAPTRADCADLLRALRGRVVDATCVASPDLTTANPDTTPANNALPTVPPFAFTPVTDRAVIAPAAPLRTPIAAAVPGWQLDGWVAEELPDGQPRQSRFLLRVPAEWNGRLVVAGASGTRSEFNGDYAWSDYVVQKGYAYASQNKGILNLYLSTAADPLACRLYPASPVFVHFYDDDPGKPFTEWAPAMIGAAGLARDALVAHAHRPPRHTYAVGTSNGGYQVRRAVELAPQLFDGGVDWEGTFVDPGAPNLLTDLPAAILNWPDYVASGFDPNSTAAENIRAAGYPPDLVAGSTSLWGLYWAAFWEVTQCQWQKRLDPTYDTYGAGTGLYHYVARLSVSDVGAQLAAFATTGAIQRPLVTVAGTMDALLPIDHHARAYARKVAAAQADLAPGQARRAPYRLYEIQNGNHIETYQATFPQLEIIEPHAQRAFDLLVDHVEKGAALPPSQCVPRGGAIEASPVRRGHCAELLVP